MAFGTHSLQVICSVCGKKFQRRWNGRPADYCSDSCRNFRKFKDAMERELLKIDFQGKHGNVVRGELFRAANLVKIGGNDGM